MFGKYKASEKRVILMNFDGLIVYGLHEGALTQLHRYEHEDQDFKNFRTYLASVPRSPVTIIVDSIAEDFAVESVAHPSFSDRKSPLKRKLNQHFRGVEYACATIFGREKKGRKDDRVLFSALTKSDFLSKWIKCLILEHVPIVSVTSPAYAIPEMAREYGFFTTANVLLVNWEASGLRQTFFSNERALFSRLIPATDEKDEDLVELIRTSSVQSKEYLERNELLSGEEELDVHVITPQLSDNAFDEFNMGKGFRTVQHHNPSSQIEHYSASGEKQAVTAVVLCIFQSMKANVLKNVYGPASTLHYHHMNLAKRFVAVSSLAVLALSVLLSVPLFMDAFDRQSHQRQLTSNTAPLQMLYDSLLLELPKTELPPVTMALAVKSYEQINLKMRTPTEMMAKVSQVVSGSPAIDLGAFVWTQLPSDLSLSLLDSILKSQTEVSVELQGSVLGSDSHQDSDNQLQSFMGLLESIPEVEVSPIRLDIEKGPESEVSTTVSDELLESEFALNVRLGI